MADGPGIIGQLEAALRATGLRGRVIGENVSNLATPGYRRKEVQFDDVLAKALAGADDEDLADEIVQARGGPVNEQGNNVSMEAEIGAMMKNGVAARVYLRAIGKLYSQMRAAIGEQV